MGVAGGPRGKSCKSYKELKEKSPTLPDGVYWLFPNGETSQGTRTYCFSSGSKHFQAVWRNWGGPIYATFGSNTNNSTMFQTPSSYDAEVAPYDVTGSMGSEINNICWDYWGNLDNVEWYARVRSYNSSGVENTGGQYTNDIWLKYYSGATYSQSLQTIPGDIGGYVSMSFNSNGTYYDYGVTRYRASNTTTTTIGFANDTDDTSIPAEEPVMGNGQSIYSSAGWEARHVLSYVHTSNGQNTVRCQFRCWNGSEGLATEKIWFVREKEDNE